MGLKSPLSPANPTTSVSVMVRAGLKKVSPALSSSRYFACIVFLMVVRDGQAPSLEAAGGLSAAVGVKAIA
jgi:hypothetical protein